MYGVIELRTLLRLSNIELLCKSYHVLHANSLTERVLMLNHNLKYYYSFNNYYRMEYRLRNAQL